MKLLKEYTKEYVDITETITDLETAICCLNDVTRDEKINISINLLKSQLTSKRLQLASLLATRLYTEDELNLKGFNQVLPDIAELI